MISIYYLLICSSLVSKHLCSSAKKYLSFWNSSSLNLSSSLSFYSVSFCNIEYSVCLLCTLRFKVLSYCLTSNAAPSSANTKSCFAWYTTHSGQRPIRSSLQKYLILSFGCISHIICNNELLYLISGAF